MNIGAVIVTYNPQISDLNILINNINEGVTQIIIVDNGSSNVSQIEKLKLISSKVLIVELGENKGIGYAQNVGIKKAFEDTQIQAVILFDHDSHPQKEMIGVLANQYEQLKNSNIQVGALGPVFHDPRTNNQYPISVFKGFSLIKKYAVEGNTEPIEASFLIASGCFIPKETIEIAGLMNEGFFIDYIDIEWSFRIKHFGLQLFVCPQATMAHQVGDSRKKILGREISIHSPLRRYYLARNSVLMIKTKYIDWKYKVREFFYTFSRVFVYLAVVNNKSTYIKYIWQGWKDGFSNKTGICTIK